MILYELITNGIATCSKCSNGAAAVDRENQTPDPRIGAGVEIQDPKCSKSSKCSNNSMISFLEPMLKSNHNNDGKMISERFATATVATVATVGLPETCPLLTGGVVPAACRFHPKLFARLLAEGVLSATYGCPLLKICKVAKPERREK